MQPSPPTVPDTRAACHRVSSRDTRAVRPPPSQTIDAGLRRRFTVTHVLLPAAVFACVLGGIALTGADMWLADRVFFDRTTDGWVGAHSFWANELVHTGGRNLARLIAGAALLVVLASWIWPRTRPWRRGAVYVVLSIVLATGIVGALKHTTNVDCPWDLEQYGGARPYVGLFADRPDALPRARCFPGAHSSSGFALMCFYFLLRDRRPRAAYVALAGGVAMGVVFAIAQEARGAHFISHDLTSAAIVWYILLALYVWMLRPKAV